MKTNIFLLFMLLVALSSCENYLEFPPEQKVPETEFLQTEADAQKAVNAMYGYLRSWDISAFNYLILENYLEFPPEQKVPETEFLQTEADAQKAVNAMYGYLRSWDISAFNYLIL